MLLALPLIIAWCTCERKRMTHTAVLHKDPTANMTAKSKEEFYQIIKRGVTHISSDTSWKNVYFHKTKQSKNLPNPKVIAKASNTNLQEQGESLCTFQIVQVFSVQAQASFHLFHSLNSYKVSLGLQGDSVGANHLDRFLNLEAKFCTLK